MSRTKGYDRRTAEIVHAPPTPSTPRWDCSCFDTQAATYVVTFSCDYCPLFQTAIVWALVGEFLPVEHSVTT